MPGLKTINSVLKRQVSFKLLGIMLEIFRKYDENISWKKHIKTVETSFLKHWFIMQNLAII